MLAAMAVHQTSSNFRTEIAPVDTKHLPKGDTQTPENDTIFGKQI
jgi:hypothetical protein